MVVVCCCVVVVVVEDCLWLCCCCVVLVVCCLLFLRCCCNLATMSDFWERTKAGFAEAAEATKTAGLKAKAMGELELLKRKLQGIKQEFGVEAFPYFEQDRTTVFTIYERYKVRADEVTNKIREKEREIQRFNDKGNDDSSFEPLFDDNKDKSAPSGGSNFQI